METRNRRLRAVLRNTLDENIRESTAVSTSRHTFSLSGPWSTVFGEHSTWDSAPPLNRHLYRDMRGHFDDNIIREILLAAADIKIARVSLREKQLPRLQSVADCYGLKIVISHALWTPCVDQGKGGWANRMIPSTQAAEANGIRNIYIASDTALAEAGKMLDEAGEDDLFGALLGIPHCCREMFDEYKHLAAKKQYDFIPVVCDNTHCDMPFDWRLNYTAQYFGGSLLSFFPCSFRCPAAVAVAEKTYRLLAACDFTWSRRFVELQHSNVIYTEHKGLHMFRTRLCNGMITYEPKDLWSTEVNELSECLRLGDRLSVIDKHSVHVYRDSTNIAEITGEDVCVCAFL
jgi:hypothetical protein